MSDDLHEIICSGPSISSVDEDDLDSDKENRCTVNEGVRLGCHLSPHRWVIRDEESFAEWWPWGEEVQARLWYPIHWTIQERSRKRFRPLYKVGREFRNYFKRTGYKSTNPGVCSIVPWDTDAQWSCSSMTTALAIEILHGAKKINIWGADFSGETSSGGEYSEDYWDELRSHLSDIKEECEDRGITIERRFP